MQLLVVLSVADALARRRSASASGPRCGRDAKNWVTNVPLVKADHVLGQLIQPRAWAQRVGVRTKAPDRLHSRAFRPPRRLSKTRRSVPIRLSAGCSWVTQHVAPRSCASARLTRVTPEPWSSALRLHAPVSCGRRAARLALMRRTIAPMPGIQLQHCRVHAVWPSAATSPAPAAGGGHEPRGASWLGRTANATSPVTPTDAYEARLPWLEFATATEANNISRLVSGLSKKPTTLGICSRAEASSA